MNKKIGISLFLCFALARSLQSADVALPATVYDKAITFIAKSLGVSVLSFTLASCANVYFSSPKKPFKDWLFDETQLKTVEKKMALGTAIVGLCAIGIAVKTDSPLLKTAATGAFLGSLASLGMIVGFDIALNTDIE